VRAKIGEGELLVGGDVILEVAGIAITPNGGSFEQIQTYLSGLKAGDSLKVNVLRGGKVVRLAAVRPR
jgi:S1-C subfamily serine protease